jgi:hypothetical protein
LGELAAGAIAAADASDDEAEAGAAPGAPMPSTLGIGSLRD